MASIFDEHTHRFFIFSGLIGEEFILSSLETVDLSQIVFRQLKEAGYERILFFHTADKVYFLDYKSAALFNRRDEGGGNAPPPRKRPLGTAGSLPSDQNTTPRLSLGLMLDTDAVVLFDRYMKDSSVKTAIVITNLPLIIQLFQTPRLKERIEDWNNLGHENQNILIFLSPTDDKDTIQGIDQWFAVRKNLSNISTTIDIRFPKRDEVKNALIRFCIHNDFDPLWIDDLDNSFYCLFLEHHFELKRFLSFLMKEDTVKALRTVINKEEFTLPQNNEPGTLLLKYLTDAIKGRKQPTGMDELEKLEGLDELKIVIKNIVESFRRKNKVLPQKPEMDQELCFPQRTIKQLSRKREDVMGLNFVFKGNPGTGKTTVARIVSKIFKEEGILSSGHLVEVGRDDLVGQYVGETAIKTARQIENAMGGMLFIDEAYSLTPKSENDFGQEAIDTLVKEMEDRKGQMSFILAGYDADMDQLMETNAGLKSRIQYHVTLPDYDEFQLAKIFRGMVEGAGYILNNELSDEVLANFFRNFAGSFTGEKFANAREVRNITEKAIINSENRNSKEISKEDISKIDVNYVEYFEDPETQIKKLQTEIDSLIGLGSVKEKLRGLIALRIHEMQSGKQSAPGHYVFLGNPGTGKTTVARLMGKYLRLLGLLKRGHVVEVFRSDLVAGYFGQSAIKTEQKIREARGGVLFVDEAYALSRQSEGGGDFGTEVIDTIMQKMEANREEMSFIFAGYTKEMEQFIKVNPGMNRRIGGNIITFQNYSADELYRIFVKMCSDTGYHINPELDPVVKQVFEGVVNEKGDDKDFGNAGFVRTFLDKMIEYYALRVQGESEYEREFIPADIPPGYSEYIAARKRTIEDVLKELNSLIGLAKVKEEIQLLMNLQQFNQGRGEKTSPGHFLFTGNPGTGKTTVARLLGEVFKHLGLLRKGHVIEANGKDLIAGYVGQSAGNTQRLIDEAMGGILFVDEAYSLTPKSDNDFGRDVINTMITTMENNREDICFIFAGYPTEMGEFIATNPGMKSRINKIIHFDNYSGEELFEIFIKYVKEKNLELADTTREEMRMILKAVEKERGVDKDFGNARDVRNMVDDIKKKMANRLACKEGDKEFVILPVDIPDEYKKYITQNERTLEEVMKELDSLIGLESVKKEVKKLANVSRVRKSKGKSKSAGHFIFTGNPGTGKTTVARLLGEIFKHLGLLRKGHVVELSRADLVAGYEGQTAIKTKEKIEGALGGILFVDEAYELNPRGDGGADFGREVINTMISLMENKRDDICFIFAGYPVEMKEFIAANPGMKSRINKIIHFPNYSSSELIEILKGFIHSGGYTASEEVLTAVKTALDKYLEEHCEGPALGNGRYIRKLFEVMEENFATRVTETDDDSQNEFKVEDIPSNLNL